MVRRAGVILGVLLRWITGIPAQESSAGDSDEFDLVLGPEDRTGPWSVDHPHFLIPGRQIHAPWDPIESA